MQERSSEDGWAQGTKVFLVTGDSEVYIDDAVCPLGAVQAGDTAEVLGYIDPDQRTRYVVDLAYIRHDVQTRPTPPDLSLPASGPADAQPDQQEE